MQHIKRSEKATPRPSEPVVTEASAATAVSESKSDEATGDVEMVSIAGEAAKAAAPEAEGEHIKF